MSAGNKNVYDIVVIGAGPGGYVAAIRAAQLGAKVAVIEAFHLGGVCLNCGCIPSKALLTSAEELYRIKNSSLLNINLDGKASVDWNGLQARKEKVIQTLRGGIARLFRANKVELFEGFAEFEDKNTIAVKGIGNNGGSLIKADKIIIATGSRPSMVRTWPQDGELISTGDEALSWKTLPKKLIIVGGGFIGCEFACMMNAFGVDVVLVEMLEEILPGIDQKISKALRSIFTYRGIKCYTGKKIVDVEIKDGKVLATLEGAESLDADRMLVAIGRVPNVDKLKLEKVGIRRDERGFIIVDDRMRTNVDNIFCIGDANGKVLLAHAASEQGQIAAENACGADLVYKSITPVCVYTFPEIASVGLTEERAKELGYTVRVGEFPVGYLGKALAAGKTEGLVRVVRDIATDKILGIHMMGYSATECIAAAAVAINHNITNEAFGRTVFAHPTMSEALKETSEAAGLFAIHLPPVERKVVAADIE